MNPVILLPLLAAACVAVPAGLHPSLVHAAPAISYAAAPATISYAAPAVAYTAHVHQPITKTVHYESKPVVTGYQTSIIKPAIATHTVASPVFTAPVAVQPAPVVVAEPAPVAVPAPAPVAVQPAPVAVEQPAAVAVQSDDTTIIENPEFRSAAPYGYQVAAAPFAVAQPAYATYSAPAAIAAPVAVAAPAPVLVRSAQAADFEPLVTKEHVLAPVRTHTQVIPQVTQVQPEVTVRKVVHDVPVATPVHVPGPQITTYQHVPVPVAQTYGYQVAAAPVATYAAAPAFSTIHKF